MPAMVVMYIFLLNTDNIKNTMSCDRSDFMSKNKKIDKDKVIDDKITNLNKQLKKYNISDSLKTNILTMKELFIDVDVFAIREVENNYDTTLQYGLAYCNGLVDSIVINQNIIKPLMLSKNVKNDDKLIDELIKHVIQVYDVKKTEKIKDIVENVTYGDVVLFIDGISEVLILNTKHSEQRSITEPENEKVIMGPREGFSESILTNLSMIRRKLRTNELKFKYHSFGDKTNTKACVCYIDSIVDKKILNELYKRLKKIKIDGVIDTNYINELIRDNPLSPFRTTGYTEKPDVIVAQLLEGRIAFFLDGTPIVLTLPYLFVENFQSGEDYYMNYFYTSFARIIRILGFIFTIATPGFYIAIIAFHHELLPTQLFINMAIERQNVPLPASIEIVVMLVVFDILKETGIRMPTSVGQALSVVGAVVIGQAAVAANLVAAPMLVVVAFTGITGLLTPKLNSPVIFIRAALLALTSTLGFFGFMIGVSLLLIHILNLKSFGISQVNPTGSLKFQGIKDTAFRAPWWHMIKRPKPLSSNQTRLKKVVLK